VTGSADGLGLAAAQTMMSDGHEVVLHARNTSRAATLRPLTDRGARIVIADLADRDAVRAMAVEIAGLGRVDAVIHNAGVWSGPAVMPVNIVAPYLLTALLPDPGRLVYLSSGSHFSGRPSLTGVDWQGRSPGSYADSKLFVTALSAAVARRRPRVLSNAVDPGWVPTKMGGPGAPDDLEQGHQTQVWLATSTERSARSSGSYWYHQTKRQPHPAVHDETFQDRLLQVLADETGTMLPT